MRKPTITDAAEAPPAAMKERRFLSPQEAADFLTKMGLKTTKSTLDTWVSRGEGAPYRKWSHRRLYEESELLAWADARLGKSRTSSSEAA